MNMNNVRYTVSTPPAFFSDANRRGRNEVTVVGSFVRKAEAMAAAQEALNIFRVCGSFVDRERFVETTEPLTGREISYWDTEARVKEYSRYLRPEERLTAEEEASRREGPVAVGRIA